MVEKGLTLEHSFREIAADLDRSPSTVMHEVQNNRVFVTSSKTKCANFTGCLQRKICGDPTCFDPCKTCREYDRHTICKDFKPFHRSKLDHAPYVCNTCEDRNICPKEHAVYSAHKADAKSRERLSDARKTLHMPSEIIEEINAGKKRAAPAPRKCRQGRTYEDLKEFIKQNFSYLPPCSYRIYALSRAVML